MVYRIVLHEFPNAGWVIASLYLVCGALRLARFNCLAAANATAANKEFKGFPIPAAAGVIHTDFERGFIAAEIVHYDDLVAAGSMSAAKVAGKVRIEGKQYVMKDGDVVEFRFNV